MIGPSRALLAAGLGCALLLAGCAPEPGPGTGGAASPRAPGTSPTRTPTPTRSARPSTPATTPAPASPATSTSQPPPSAAGCAARLSLSQQVGQLFVMGVSATGATQAELDLLRATHAGAVILMGNSEASVSGVSSVTDAARQAATGPDGVGLLVTVDQEGGRVRRLRGPGFSDVPSAATQATWSDATLRARAKTWARQLQRAGVDVDLAPVADVVPASVGEQNEPVAALDRGYGSDPQQVARKVAAFVTGMAAAGEGTTVKHFPGLGAVTGNTDFASSVVDRTTTRGSDLLAGFDAGIAAGADMVMVSTAYYTKIDPDRPAAFSPTVIEGMLRGDRNYRGVVVSDDLGVAEAVSDRPPGQRATSFLEAGGDLVINVKAATVDDMVDAVLARARKDPGFARRVARSAGRVLAMKTQLGLADCG